MSPEKLTKNNGVILGIDPGSTTVGYGVIAGNHNNNTKPSIINYGYIDLKNHKCKEEKLLHLHKDICYLLKKFKPSSLAIENIYFFKNAKTITSVLQSKGVILLAAAQAKIKIFEYTPLQVKQTITGYGKADKKLIQKLIQSSFKIKNEIKPDDTSDAIAIALCHFQHLTIC